MKSIIRISFAFALGALTAAGCGDAAHERNSGDSTGAAGVSSSESVDVRTYTFGGTPTKIDESAGIITIDHEAIEGYMDAMTMPYEVADPALLKRAVVGREALFTLRVTGHHGVIVGVEGAGASR